MSDQNVQRPDDHHEPKSEVHQAGDDGRTHMFDDPKNVTRLVNGFYVCCVILVILDFVIDRHDYHPWERIPAFHAIYGFGACWMLVVIAKQMRRVLMRDEDYYDGV